MPDQPQPQRPEEAAALAAAAAGAQPGALPVAAVARLEFRSFESIEVAVDAERNRSIVALSALPKLIVVMAFPPQVAETVGKALIAPGVQLPGGTPPSPNGEGPA